MIHALFAQAAELKDAVKTITDSQTLDSAILGEQFYFFTVVLMWLIHVGFMTYEAGVARRKNVMATAMKNILTIAVGHADLLLLRLVDLQLQPARPADRPQLERLHQRRLPGRHPLERRFGPNLTNNINLVFFLGLPAVLVDDGLDHVGRAARARPAVGLPGCSPACSARWSGCSTPPGAGAPAAG